MKMHLNNVNAKPGTIIGVDFRTKRFLAVENTYKFDVTTFGESKPRYLRAVKLRFAEAEEVRPQAFKHEPRSVMEHRSIPRRASVYGLIRQYKPTPVKAVKIEIPINNPTNRRQRRALRRIYGRDLNL